MAAFRKATTYWFWGARLLGNRLKANTLTHAKNTANRSGLRPRTSRSVSRPGEQALAHLCGVTLNRHRGKGQQKVTVEHVHVHEGGQAIVGEVHAGRVVVANSGNQAHEKAIAHAPEPEVRRSFTDDGEALPERCDEER